MWSVCMAAWWLPAVFSSSWNYSDIDQWPVDFPACGGQHQSPLDLNFQDLPFWPNASDDKLHFNYSNSNVTVEFSNFTVAVTVESPESTLVANHLGLLNSYVLSQLHFHWDSVDTRGSEHRINGKPYPLEMHVLHYHAGCASFIECLNVTGGVAVYGVLFEVGAPHEGLQLLLDAFNHSGRVNDFPVTSFLSDTARTDFMYYQGSLTAPPCAEVVSWILARQVLTVSQQQLEIFRSLWNGQTWRPTQAYNSRTVQTSWPTPTWRYTSWEGSPGLPNAEWKEGWSGCGGSAQSPIDLPAMLVGEGTRSVENLQSSYGSQQQSSLLNTGCALQVDVAGNLTFRTRSYHLRQLHFHWANADDHGAEHTRKGARFPLEMHMVHWDASFPSFTEASTADSESLLVMGVHFTISPEDNPYLSHLFAHLNEVVYPSNRSAVLPKFDLDGLLPAAFDVGFQSYHGSLTTPPCFESVQWVFLVSTLGVSLPQLQQLRNLKRGVGQSLGENWRQTQPLNGRVIVNNLVSDEPDVRPGWDYLAAGLGAALFLAFLCFFFCWRRNNPKGVPLNTPLLVNAGDA